VLEVDRDRRPTDAREGEDESRQRDEDERELEQTPDDVLADLQCRTSFIDRAVGPGECPARPSRYACGAYPFV
jgi:hypothetical protein